MKFMMVVVTGKIKDGLQMMKMIMEVLNTVGKELMRKKNQQNQLKVNSE